MTVYRFGPFRLDKEQLLLSLEDTNLALGPKVVETLLALVERPGEVLAKPELLDRIWPDGFVEEANLAQNIYVIRKALRAHWGVDAIETVPRRGYRFNGEVRFEQSEPAHRIDEPASVKARSRAYLRLAAAGMAAALIAVVAMVPRASASRAFVRVQSLSPSGARLYAMGEFYWNQRTAPAIAKSIRYFQAVVQSDPRDARGYAGLASAYAVEGDYGFGHISKKQAFARATAYAHSALERNRASAEAHAVLGFVAMDAMRMKQGMAEYRNAISLDPGSAMAHQWYGVSLLQDGKVEQAYEQLKQAADLDPESVAAVDWLSHAAFIARRYNDAIAYARQTLDLSPQRYDVYASLGMAYEAVGNYSAAIAAYKTLSRTCQECSFEASALLAHAYAAIHDQANAWQQLQHAERGIASRKAGKDDVAVALAAMGRMNDAMAMLRKLIHEEPSAGGLLAADPRMDALRGDARFRQVTQGPG